MFTAEKLLLARSDKMKDKSHLGHLRAGDGNEDRRLFWSTGAAHKR
jgi:hypothetical protein